MFLLEIFPLLQYFFITLSPQNVTNKKCLLSSVVHLQNLPIKQV